MHSFVMISFLRNVLTHFALHLTIITSRSTTNMMAKHAVLALATCADWHL